MSAKDLYIQNTTVLEHDNHSDSFRVKFPNVNRNYMTEEVRVEDQKFINLGSLQIYFMADTIEFRCL